MAVASSTGLVGREVELGALDRFVASFEGGAATLLVCGGPGIGKTAVWQAGLERARVAGVRVQRTRCAEVEMPIAFGALSDLLVRVLEEPREARLQAPPAGPHETALEKPLEGLAPRLRDALAAAFGGGGPSADDARVDWLLLATATLAVLRALAERGPVLVAIDDLQWLDSGSRRVLAYALRRIGDAPVGLLATLRDEGADADPLALADVLAPGRFVRMDLAALSSGALGHLIARRLGAHLSRPALGRVHRASGGNPMFGLEFARMLVEGRHAREEGPLEVPSSLESLVRARVAALPVRLSPLLEVVAALERPALPLVAQALEDPSGLDVLLADAVAAEVLVVSEDELVDFAHPLLAAAVYYALPPGRRRAVHHRLAELADGAEERGRHAALAASEPDAATAVLAERGATAAAARGALDFAAELMAAAVRLTPPTEPDVRHRRLLTRAGWLVETGEFASGREALEPLFAPGVPAGVRVEALLLRAECEMTDRHRLIDLLQEALATAEEPEQRWRALIRLAQHGGWVSGNASFAADTADEALELARTLDEPSLVEISAAALGFYEAARGRLPVRPRDVRGTGPGPAAARSDLAAREDLPPGLEGTAPLPRMQWWQISPAVSLGCRLLWAGELSGARAILERERERQASTGHEAKAGFVQSLLAELEWRAGAWERAEALADEATERLGDVNPTAFPRALLAAGRGRTEEAYAIAEPVLAWSESNDERVAPPRFRWLLGLLELSAGDPRRARPLLLAAQTELDAAGIAEPGYLPVLPDLIESSLALGLTDEAETLLGRLEASASSLAHRFAAVAAKRSRALLLLAREEAAASAQLATGAAAELAAMGMPLDRGRALVAAGSALRRLGERRRAAEPLGEATRIFTELGAAFWLEQAEAELRRASPRPQRERDGRLTAAEARVATLVASGRKNKEVAAELYTSVATVEAHLTRIYRKLDIRSRSELTRLAAEGTLELEPEH